MFIRYEERPAFRVVGTKAWIGGTSDDEAFGRFYRECRVNGSLDALDRIHKREVSVTGSAIIGISRVEDDPSNRSFFFYVCTETDATPPPGFEAFTVPASKWAVFGNRGSMPQALVAAEMHAFRDWLPASGYEHAMAPEMETYPDTGNRDEGPGMYCEFWLPIRPKGQA